MKARCLNHASFGVVLSKSLNDVFTLTLAILSELYLIITARIQEEPILKPN